MPSAWEVQFSGIDPSHVRASGIHRFLSSWFCETVGEHAGLKGYSIGARRDHRTGISIQVRCIDDQLADLVAAIPAGHPVQFGTTYPHLATVAHAPQQVVATSWNDLATYRSTTQWRLHLQSPVVVSYQKVDQPWPAPGPLLKGLDAKWRAWGPESELPLDERIPLLIAVTGAELHTVESRLPPQPVWGATGMVEWTWVGALSTRHADLARGAEVVERLLGLAQFAGVGGYTQHGLGSVSVSGRHVDARQPRVA